LKSILKSYNKPYIYEINHQSKQDKEEESNYYCPVN